jgi:hypothetical protein
MIGIEGQRSEFPHDFSGAIIAKLIDKKPLYGIISPYQPKG